MDTWTARLARGDERAVARAVSYIEAGDPRGARLLAELRREVPAGSARLIGITGSPGSGKSTLVDRLVEAARARDERVAVVAVDPTSPFSGGALLGDRIRMTRWHDDPDVFIRSMATRGHLGGLAAATLQATGMLEAAGFDLVLIETVGVGQSEVDVVSVADSTILVLTPSAGDGVQAFKAGVSEIADVFVVNKSDLPGADRLRKEIRAAQTLAPIDPDAWRPPAVLVTAHDGGGVAELVEALDAHRRHLTRGGELARRRRVRVRTELAAALQQRVRRALAARDEELVEAVSAGRLTAEAAVDALLTALAHDDA